MLAFTSKEEEEDDEGEEDRKLENLGFEGERGCRREEKASSLFVCLCFVILGVC